MTLLTSQEFPAQSMSVRTAKLFKSDVQSVPLLHGHIGAVDHATGSLLCQYCSDHIDATLQSVVLSDGRRHGSGSGRLVQIA